MKRTTSFAFASLVLVAACGDNSKSSQGEAPTCADTQCDPNATCSDASGDPVCTCNTGYSGDGETCADIDECTASSNACAAGLTCVNAPGGFDCLASTCAGILAQQPGAQDGEYTLYVGGDPAKSWTAYCANMATAPKEYLTLVTVGPDSNFGQYTAGGISPGISVRTNYTKVAIDPVALTIDIGDQSFATSTGRLSHSGTDRVSSMPIGVAMSCDSTASGLANIDLQGTEFAVTDAFGLGGYSPLGVTTVSNNGQTIELTGGGGCGWNGPTAATYNPFNATSAPLSLKLI